MNLKMIEADIQDLFLQDSEEPCEELTEKNRALSSDRRGERASGRDRSS